MSAISDCVDGIKGLTPKQRMILTVMLQGAALPLAVGPIGWEKDRQRTVDKVRTHAKSLRRAIAHLDPDARDYVGHVADGGANNAGALECNAAKAAASLRELDRVLKRLEGLMKPYPSPFKVSRELVMASGVVEALEYLGLPCVVSDTSLAAACFRAVAGYAGVKIAENGERYWLGKAKSM